jgi:hypothetical protein
VVTTTRTSVSSSFGRAWPTMAWSCSAFMVSRMTRRPGSQLVVLGSTMRSWLGPSRSSKPIAYESGEGRRASGARRRVAWHRITPIRPHVVKSATCVFGSGS